MSGRNEKKRVEPKSAARMPTIRQSVRRCSGEWLNALAKEGSMYASAAQAEIRRRARRREKRGLWFFEGLFSEPVIFRQRSK